MIQEVGNIELFEWFEMDPKTQCTACLSFWNMGIVHSLHMQAFLAESKSGQPKIR